MVIYVILVWKIPFTLHAKTIICLSRLQWTQGNRMKPKACRTSVAQAALFLLWARGVTAHSASCDWPARGQRRWLAEMQKGGQSRLFFLADKRPGMFP